MKLLAFPMPIRRFIPDPVAASRAPRALRLTIVLLVRSAAITVAVVVPLLTNRSPWPLSKTVADGTDVDPVTRLLLPETIAVLPFSGPVAVWNTIDVKGAAAASTCDAKPRWMSLDTLTATCKPATAPVIVDPLIQAPCNTIVW